MVRSATPEPSGSDQSLGDLVSLAMKDVSQLVRYEIDLAKSEFRADLKRVLRASVLFGIAAFFGCLILFSLCFMWAYLLNTLGAPGGMWGAFGWTALTLLILALITGGIAALMMRHMSGMKKTRKSVTEGLGMLRRDGKEHDGKEHDGKDDAKALASADGHAPRRARRASLRSGTSESTAEGTSQGTGQGTGQGAGTSPGGGQSPAGEAAADGLPAEIPDRTPR
jgi:uncharacterized membrane protein YqjE